MTAGTDTAETRETAGRPSGIDERDLHLFNEGTHLRLHEVLGAHPEPDGTRFAVWAPNARSVSVIGDFNDWEPERHPLSPVGDSGIWEVRVPDVPEGSLYKYGIVPRDGSSPRVKTDPLATRYETPPRTASMVWDLQYEWGDHDWMAARRERNDLAAPISIYEVHLGSWRRRSDDGSFPSYRELAPVLADYVADSGFTHVELLPVMEHPFYGSWGYQTTGYFAPSSRYGEPQGLMHLIDTLHQRGIGVVLDWVPSHFPTDDHALGEFDGTHLYEHADPKEGFHPDWTSYVFNYGRHEVRSFLLSSAHFWLDRYHADGLRVDAVASMLYRDYSRPEGDWIPNVHGGRENLEAIRFLRELNESVYREFPGVQTFAEESTAWPMVSRPTHVGGLGFGLKWDMGWMHDMLEYMQEDPVHRKYHHDHLTFRMLYAFSENFTLPLSHDEVVHGKGSLLEKMPGDDWQKFANLRLLLGSMYGQPGKKLLFMGGEFGQRREWAHDEELDWQLLDQPAHRGVRRWIADLNRVYRQEPALHRGDCEAAGHEWVDAADTLHSVVSYLRRDPGSNRAVLVVANFTPVPRTGYRVGVPRPGRWRELLNSDAEPYGGSGQGNLGGREAEGVEHHGRDWSLELTLPPLGIVFLKRAGEE